MCVCLAGLGVPQEGIDDIKQNGFGLVVECFDVFEALDGLLVVGRMLALSEQVVYRYIEHLGDLESHLDGGAVLVALILADDIPGGADCFGEVCLGPVVAFAQFGYFASNVEHVLLKIEFLNRLPQN